ncbi:MAG: acylphosphatase [Verrucomicrobia bacterium 61-8]|nr:acylphosphatase [Verrucomicrobiota bacterium]OJV01157.1 MAG: acylphosphatase [Verrucomicrobia bacterium 61-8]
MNATRVFYEGRVQGVGFRWTARKIAQGYDVTGLVRNLPDGRVELQVSGDDGEVDAFLTDIRDSVLAGHITTEQREKISLPNAFRGFQIIS